MSDQSVSTASGADSGWFVVVTVPKVGFGSSHQVSFAAAIPDSSVAKRAVQKALGGLHCVVEVRFRMSPKALGRLNVPKGAIKRVSSY